MPVTQASLGRTRTRTRTIETELDPRRNSLNALRLLLASLVIVSHAWPLTGAGDEPEVGGQTLGGWAVGGFFVISGFLITRSRERRGLRKYFWDRFLRIYPAYLVALLVVAFVFAPVSLLATDGTTYDPVDAVGYVVRNLPLYAPRLFQDGIGDTVGPATGLPFSGIWNGPLWTLFYEALCYVAVAVAVSVLPHRWLGPAMLGSAAVLTAGCLVIYNTSATIPDPLMRAVVLGASFATGSAIYLYRRRLPLGARSAGVAFATLVVVCVVGQAAGLAAAPFGMVLLYLGAVLPLSGVGSSYDISYGMYIYGWPVQVMVMLVALHLGREPSMWINLPVVVLVTAGLAWLSSHFVERPALRLKDRLGDTGRAAVG